MVITKFGGIVNTVSARVIPSNPEAGTGLQDAIDVDITNAGGIVARPGYPLTPTISVNISTAYDTLDGVSYAISDGYLKRARPGPAYDTLVASTATEFDDYQRYLFTNDGYMVFEETVSDIKVPVPREPEIVITGGTLPAGRYLIVSTFTNASGLEGGTSPIVEIELDAEGEILITPEERAGYTPNVYITETGGEVFYDRVSGKQIAPELVNANPFPDNAHKVAYFDNRLYVSARMGDHTVVWFSKPYQYHLYGVDDGYFVVPGSVRDMKGISQGLIIGTDRAVYAYAEGSLTELAKYGVVPGRSILKLPDDTVRIHTIRGVCSALPFQELTQDTVSLHMGSKVSTVVMYNNGIRKYVALHDAGGSAFNLSLIHI